MNFNLTYSISFNIQYVFIIFCHLCIFNLHFIGMNQCNLKQANKIDSINCPTKSCNQHIDCWVSYGPSQRCVCDPIMCGSVCLPENAKCPEPAPLLNGNVVYNDTDVGDIVEYTCKSGLTVRGQRRRYCLATLNWSGTAPTCSNQTETCFSPPAILNTRIIQIEQNVTEKLRDDYRSGEKVTIQCMPGYNDAEKQFTEALCIGTEWHYTELKCERVSCGFIKEPTYGYIQYKYDQRFQAEAIISCLDGYKIYCNTGLLSLENGLGCKRICLENGSWSGEEVLCKAITCSEPQIILNGEHMISSLKVNGTYTTKCNEGYELYGSSNRICQINGKWSGEEPYCKKSDCGPPPQIQNGEVSFTTTTYGSKGRVICEIDTTLSVENDEIECGVIDSITLWKPQPFPECRRHCYLFTVEHGDVYLIHRNHNGDKHIIQITTEEFGLGDTEMYSTNPISNLVILPGGKVRHGSELNVTCQVGYALIKPNHPITTCQNGVWSVRSKCVPAPCRRRPPNYPGSRVRFYSLKHNSLARYEPFPGYRLQTTPDNLHQINRVNVNEERKGTLRCLYGEWVGAPLKFEPMYCPSIDIKKPLNVEISIDGKLYNLHNLTIPLKQDTIFIFSCPNDYYLNGPKYIVCHLGHWLPKTTTSCQQTPSMSTLQRWLFSSG
ncbi:hypothetical protein MN116_000641 [Schistosoma mekongi]|uniref:Sushi domain-containing protein n=1 Tax=Schistosoma mekongi TaxID=38744 RepID=A0AAE2D8S4_SCHME|nr:hypothetical protein MN116_000641 [Schistosoma mekongi]